MAVLEGGVSAALAGVGAQAGQGEHFTLKPLSYGTLGYDGPTGHYRTRFRLQPPASTVAASPLWTIRNAGPLLVVLTRLVLRISQIAIAGTAQADRIAAVHYSGMVSDPTTNFSNPTMSIKRGSTMAPAPTATVFQWTGAGTTGMSSPAADSVSNGTIAELPFIVSAAAINTTTIWGPLDVLDDMNGAHPFALATNEAIKILSGGLTMGIPPGIAIHIDCSWAEVPAF
jgi:hypothetical protein